MQQSQLPIRITTPWAEDAVDPTYRHTVPVASQIGITNGAASFEDGFPPLTFQPVASGGVPPFGNDVNGIFYNVTQWLRWLQAGGIVPYNAAFSTAVTGYPLGACVASAMTAKKFYVSTAENNTTDPDAGGAGWEAFYVGNSGVVAGDYVRPALTIRDDGTISDIASGSYPTRTTLTSGNGTYTVPANVKRIFVRMVGGGGGGGGSGAGGIGGTTSFNSITAIGGSGGGLGNTAGANGSGGSGGTGGTGSAWRRMDGAPGNPGIGSFSQVALNVSLVPSGGKGGDSLLGPGGKAGDGAGSGGAAPANSGGGGGGRSNTSGGTGLAGGGGGGGSGEYVEFQIAPTAASYSYSVGAAGAAGSSGGGAGGSGVIIIDEFYD